MARAPVTIGPRHDTILHFINAYRAASEGFSPTMRQIAEHIGVKAGYQVQSPINLLVREGYLRRKEGQAHNNLLLTPLGRARIGLVNKAHTPKPPATRKPRATSHGSALGQPHPAQLAHG
jgi:SOS-response transcriptional repressor LexA